MAIDVFSCEMPTHITGLFFCWDFFFIMFLKEFFIYWGTNSWILCWRISFPGVACLTCLFLQTCVSLPCVIGNFSILSLIFLFGFISQGHIVINYMVCRGQAQFVPGFYHCLCISSHDSLFSGLIFLWSSLSHELH